MNRYHPWEIVVRGGAAGPGQALVAALVAEGFEVGHVEHGTGAETDLPASSRDASREEAGARVALSLDGRASRWRRTGHPELQLQSALLGCVDLAVVEGELDGEEAPVLLALDAGGGGLERLEPATRARVAALWGVVPPPADALPAGGIPRFASGQEAELAGHLLDALEARARSRPFSGLLFDGGDESAESAAALLTGACATVRVACPSDREAHWRKQGLEPLTGIPGWGELGLIERALAAFDGPCLVFSSRFVGGGETLLARLLEGRNPLGDATGFRGREDHVPEPLCAVWEPRSRALILRMVASGTLCPRRTLVQGRTTLLDRPTFWPA